MIVVPYQSHHYAALKLQTAQALFAGYVAAEYADWLGQAGPAFTLVDDSGVLAICGVAEEWEGRAQCWALLSPTFGPYMVVATRLIRRYFDAAPYRRIEAQTPQDFPEGRRWLRLLGFKEEGAMANYYPDGRTAIRYARCAK